MSIIGTVIFLIMISTIAISIVALAKANKAEKTAADLQARYISALERGQSGPETLTQ